MKSDQWFRSYDYGFVHRGVCLWWRMLGDGRLHIAHEFVHQYLSVQDICMNIKRITHELQISKCRYTVADRYSMGSRHSDDTGETRADLFSANGVPVMPANHDRVQGWTRVREFFTVRPDGLPCLTISPGCRYLVRTLASAVSDKNNPEDVAEFEDDHALSSLRYGAMSRPAPHSRGLPPPRPNTAGELLANVRNHPIENPFGFR